MTAAEEQLVAELAEALWREDSGTEVPLSTRMPGTQRTYARVAAKLLPVMLADRRRAVAEAEQRGYDRARRDYQFAPEGDNHHNAALCPYCTPARADAVEGGGR